MYFTINLKDFSFGLKNKIKIFLLGYFKYFISFNIISHSKY